MCVCVCVCGRESDIIATEGCGRLNEFSHFGSFFRSRLDFILVSFCLFASCELPLFPPRPQPLFPFRPFVFSLYNLVPLPFFFFLLPLLSFGICLLPGATSHLPSFLFPNNFHHRSAFPSSTPPDFSSLLPVSPPCFLLNSISLGSSFLPFFLFLSCFLSYSSLSFLLPTLLLLFLSLQSLLSLLPSLHLVSLLPCFHLTSFIIMSPRTSCFPFIFPSLHPPPVLLSSLLSFMSCSLSLQYLFCCWSFWILFTSPYPSYFHYFLHFLSSLFPFFRLWLFTFLLSRSLSPPVHLYIISS